MMKFISFAIVAYLLAALPLSTTAQLKQIFVTDTVFRHPESAVYDANRSMVYISNLDKNTPEDSLYTDCISSMNIQGEVIDNCWIKGLSSPTGLALYQGFMYAVERNGVAMIDPGTREVISRYDIQATGFLNDISIDSDGVIYVSETSDKGKIYKIVKGDVFVWIEDTTLAKPNGLLQKDAYLYVGVNVDHHLKRIHLETGEIENVALLGPGNIDGIQQNEHELLVSHFMGNLYAIKADGAVEELLNTREQDIFIADFCFIPSERLLIIPSLRTNKVYGYRFED